MEHARKPSKALPFLEWKYFLRGRFKGSVPVFNPFPSSFSWLTPLLTSSISRPSAYFGRGLVPLTQHPSSLLYTLKPTTQTIFHRSFADSASLSPSSTSWPLIIASYPEAARSSPRPRILSVELWKEALLL